MNTSIILHFPYDIHGYCLLSELLRLFIIVSRYDTYTYIHTYTPNLNRKLSFETHTPPPDTSSSTGGGIRIMELRGHFKVAMLIWDMWIDFLRWDGAVTVVPTQARARESRRQPREARLRPVASSWRRREHLFCRRATQGIDIASKDDSWTYMYVWDRFIMDQYFPVAISTPFHCRTEQAAISHQHNRRTNTGGRLRGQSS